MLIGVLVLLAVAGSLALAGIASGALELLVLARLRRGGAEADAVCTGHTWGTSRKIYRLEFTDSRGGVHRTWTPRYCEAGRTYPVLYDPSRPERSALVPLRVWDPARPRQVMMLLGFAGLVVLGAIVLVME
ncbi:DUF3592 domain-containing protein [Streptomyces sp. NPDC059452]|uniref:DUF3592 domain-containing protein n=1 Tax=Streptomyces sp. NPDC059452 TaxID=3346835 RepID=UPI0036CBF94B